MATEDELVRDRVRGESLPLMRESPRNPREEVWDLCAVEARDLLDMAVPVQHGFREGPVTFDAGATPPVANPELHLPGAKVVPSAASSNCGAARSLQRTRVSQELAIRNEKYETIGVVIVWWLGPSQGIPQTEKRDSDSC